MVSSGADVQLLGVPKLPNGTGHNQANEVCSLIEAWKISDRVVGMGFDTTASNTGARKGACTLIENKLNRDLLWLACRHHIAEILMTAAWEKLFSSKGPSSNIFIKFKSAWSTMQTAYDENMVDVSIIAELGDERYDIIGFLREQTAIKQKRQDYKELLDIALAFLGVRNIKFTPPGAHSNARWMAKSIYCLKIWLFRNQFAMTAHEQENIRIICIFILGIYIFAWYNAPLPHSAARNDLLLAIKLLQFRDDFPNETKNVYAAAASRFENHLWYLSEELVAMALFDSGVSVEEKRKMVHNIKYRKSGELRNIKMIVSSLDELKSSEISDCTSQRSMTFFDMTGISASFIEEDPSEWEELDCFLEGKDTIKSLLVVNDCAERGVKLIQDFCGKLTKNEEQLQYLLQVVQQHRKVFPASTRNIIMEGIGIQKT